LSRLDSFIRRLQAQRACLAHAVRLVGDAAGPVFEVGLGNGRTYDHLRHALPGRVIIAFDRQLAAHPDCVPPADFLVLGDIRTTVSAIVAAQGRPVLLHSDIGSGDEAGNAALAADLAPYYAAALAPGGVVVSDQSLTDPRLAALDLPDGVAPGRYFIYRRR